MKYEKKITDIAAYFLLKTDTKQMNYRKLNMLMYLSEREFIKKHYDSLTFNKMKSTEHGPVLVETLDLMEGNRPSNYKGWNSKINKSEGGMISLKKGIKAKDLGRLSQADREIMDEIWKKFGGISPIKLEEYAKQNCPEWQDPSKSTIPIKVETLCEALNFDVGEIYATEYRIEDSLSLLSSDYHSYKDDYYLDYKRDIDWSNPYTEVRADKRRLKEQKADSRKNYKRIEVVAKMMAEYSEELLHQFDVDVSDHKDNYKFIKNCSKIINFLLHKAYWDERNVKNIEQSIRNSIKKDRKNRKKKKSNKTK